MRTTFTFLLLTLVVAPFRLTAGPVTDEHRAAIAAAVPTRAPATPVRPRKLLVYSQTKGYRHASIETGVAALTLMGERTGAYTVTATEDPAILTAEGLRPFDAILFLNVTGSIFDRVESQQVLLDFVRGGRGIAGIHSATDACYEWPEWGAMFGGWFDGHPWSARAHVTVAIEEPSHPLNAPFGGAHSFGVQDEIYQLKGPDFRATHRVLASLDPRRTDMTLPGIKRADRDFPITQIREYGKGRVFYCALGHNHHIFWNTEILGHYLAGLQWVMGDLAADATPRPRPAPVALIDDPKFWEVQRSTGYDADPRILARFDAALAEAGRDARKLAALEQRLRELVADEAAAPAARQAAAERLALVLPSHPPRNHPALAALRPMLADPARVEWARLALDPVAGRSVDEVFAGALTEARGTARLAVIQSIAARRAAPAVPALERLLRDPDAAVAASAALALGEIGNSAAIKALGAAPDRNSPAVVEARLRAGAHAGTAAATKLYREIYEHPGLPEAARATALRGLIRVRPQGALKLIRDTLSGNVLAFQQVAVEAVATLPARDTVPQLAAAMGSWSPEVQGALVAAFGRRGDAAAVPVLTRLLDGEDAALRLAAIDALGRIPGSTETASRLAHLAANGGDEGKAAAEALARLAGPGIDAFVVAQAGAGETALRVEFLRQLARRGQTEAVPFLLGLRTDPDAEARSAALASLGDLASAAEQPALIAWALGAAETAERNRAVRSLIDVVLRDDAVVTRADVVLGAMRAGDGAARLALLPVLSRAGGAAARDYLGVLALDGEPELSGAAVVALGRWPDRSSAATLATVAEKAGADRLRESALAAALGRLEREGDTAGMDAITVFDRLLALPATSVQREQMLLLLARGTDERAEAVAARAGSDPTLAEASRDAVNSIRANRAWPPSVKASAAAGEAARIADGRTATRWSTAAREGEWLQLDLKHSRPVRKITLNPGNNANHHEELTIFVSDDANAPGEARLVHRGEDGSAELILPPGVRGRHVWLKHTATRAEGTWMVAEITIE